MIIKERIYQTADGRYVSAGDPDAAFLAFPAGTEISDHQAERLGLKSRAKREDKSRAKSGDKAASKPAPKRSQKEDTEGAPESK